jgi:hypothetical protein
VTFEWDENKNQANRAKHGISFETAALVFEDSNRLLFIERIEDGDPSRTSHEIWCRRGSWALTALVSVAAKKGTKMAAKQTLDGEDRSEMIAEEERRGRKIGEKWSAILVPSPAASNILAPRPSSPAASRRTVNQLSHSYILAYNPRVIPSCAASFRWPSDTHVVTHRA